MPRTLSLLLSMTLLLIVGLTSVGCGGGGYRLYGKVIRGEISAAVLVTSDDARLFERGLSNARIRIDRDADTLGRHTVASGVSDADGYFAIPVSEFGAGWMVETWGISASRLGYQNLDSLMALPKSGSHEQVLIIMAEGAAQPTERDDLWQEYERHK